MGDALCPERVCLHSEESKNLHCPQFKAMVESRGFINGLTQEI